jgi:transposase
VRHYAKLLRLGKLAVVLPPGWPGPSAGPPAAAGGLSAGGPAAPPSDVGCTTRLPDAAAQNLPGAPPGSYEAKPAGAPPGSTASAGSGSAQSASQCEPFRQVILDKLEQGLSRKRIWQDLVVEHGFTAAYHSVKRFVRQLGKSTPLPFRRIEVEPGTEAQVDFGKGAPICRDASRRRTHVFRIVLSFSRKGYSEAVFRQTTDDFLGCLENAFFSFGGVPRVVVIDNLKAAVARADWFDPELHPKVRSFCQHYGCAIVPTKPYTPRHKGKVESGVNFVQSNGLKGHRFASLPEENRHLWHWEATVADTRIHGTTRQQVGKLFTEVEKPALLPLPAERFPFFHEAQRSVHLDGHVQIEHSCYSVPPEYVGRMVWVRWDARTVRVFNHRFEQITFHARRDNGKRFTTLNPHIPREKRHGAEIRSFGT